MRVRAGSGSFESARTGVAGRPRYRPALHLQLADSAALAAAFQDGLTGISAALEAIPDTVNNLFADLAAGAW